MASVKGVTAMDNSLLHRRKVPPGWMLAKLGELAEINPKGFPRLADEAEVSFIPMAMVEEETGRVDLSTTKRYREVRKGYTPFINGDIIFAKITPCMENGKIAVVESLKNGVGFGSTEFHVIRPKNMMSPKFFFYCLMNKDFRNDAQRHMRGTAGQQRVPAEFLIETFLPVPPFPEQQKIVLILSKIDDLIQNTEEIDKQTQRLKKGLMQRLLPKGIGHNKFKQTDIGNIPDEWEVSTIGKQCKVGTGGTPSRRNPEYFDGTIPWVKTGEIDFCFIKSTEEHITERALNETSAKLYPKGTLLIAMYGQGITRGKSAILDIDAAVNQACAAIQPTGSIHIPYLFYLCQLNYNHIRNIGQGSFQSNSNLELIRSMKIPVPPMEEQKKIVDIISSVEYEGTVIQQYKKALEKLKKGLMHTLLTGKIRVKV